MSAPKLSNLDCTRRRVVKKGCVVQYPGGAIARVVRVRLGAFWTDLGARSGPSESWLACSQVKVVSD
jgi:hypothetical protein